MDKFENIKTTRSRPYNLEYINHINEYLKKKKVDREKRAIIIGNIIEESGGDPLATSSDNLYKGLLQWASDRYNIKNNKDVYKEIDNQLDYLLKTIDNTTDKVSWTHGGKGSGYKRAVDAYETFNRADTTLDVRHRAFSWGYVRPKGKEDSYKNRMKVVNQVYDRLITDESPVIKSITRTMDNISSFLGFPRKATGGFVKGLNDVNLSENITGKNYTLDDVKNALANDTLLAVNGFFKQENQFNSREEYSDYLESDEAARVSNLSSDWKTLIEESKAYNKSLDKNDRVIGRRKRLNNYLEYLENLQKERLGIFNQMQTKIEDDVTLARQTPNELSEGLGFYSKYGGYIRRKRFDTGGLYTDASSVQYGKTIKPINLDYKDYSARGEGIVGNSALTGAGTGVGIGASIGGIVGTIVPGIGNLIGALIGAGIGGAVGTGTGAGIGVSKRKKEEQRRAIELAQIKEANRQQTIGNMATKLENDVAQIRNKSDNMFTEGTSFYAKYGGFFNRKKLANGGDINNNSSTTKVVYGNTHDQIDPKTGMTGVTYGDVEVEGGGKIGNRELAGEVIEQTPMGDRVFSDRLLIPGTRASYADIARHISNQKGLAEQEGKRLNNLVKYDFKLIDKSKTNKLKTGTHIRNTEKDMLRRNIQIGKIAHKTEQLDRLFDTQEKQATLMGLRDDNGNNNQVANGGYIFYRPKYRNAGLIGTGVNAATSLLNFGAQMMSARAQERAIDWERKLPIPKQSKMDYIPIDVTYNANRELQDITNSMKNIEHYIINNTSSNPIARNALVNLMLKGMTAKNKVYETKYTAEKAARDTNITNRTNVNNQNRTIDYTNIINEYNKMTNLNRATSQINTQRWQAAMNLFNDVSDITHDYLYGKFGEKLFDDAVLKELQAGKNVKYNNRLIRRRLNRYSDKQMKDYINETDKYLKSIGLHS